MREVWIIEVIVPGGKPQAILEDGKIAEFPDEPACWSWCNQNKEDLNSGQFYVPTKTYVKIEE